ncbi:MAG: nucleotide exchange factor GrpE, partial [Chitinophagales bacterium]
MEEQEIKDEMQETAENQAANLPVEEAPVDETSSALKELEEQKDKYIRLLAEFENFKRRTSKERIELIKTAGQEVIKDLLPSLDDVDRAEQVVAAAKDLEAVK